MKLLVIRNDNTEFTTLNELYNKLKIQEYNITQDELESFDELKKSFQISSSDINTIEKLFDHLGLDDYLADIADEILDWGFWIAENDGYNSIHYNSLRILKCGDMYLGYEDRSDDYSSFVDRQMFRYLIKNNIDSITAIYQDATYNRV